MTNSHEGAVSTGLNKLKLSVSVVLLLAGIVAFYALEKQGLWLRVVSLIGLMLASVLVFFISQPGKELIAFGRDSVRETRKVVWPTRKEAGQMTMYVFAFVFVMSLFLWVTDKTVEWMLYDLILGWKR
jgi:preprotein translocase subunit SecE